MVDTYALLEEGVRHGIARVLDEYDLDPLLKTLPEERAFELGLDAARHALAPLIWRALVGEALDTEHVRELLGVTRQALYQRVERGTLLGLPGERTTLFPVWQFDDRGARAATSQIVSAFREALEDDYEPLLVASWAVTPQPELDDRSPRTGSQPAVPRNRWSCRPSGRPRRLRGERAGSAGRLPGPSDSSGPRSARSRCSRSLGILHQNLKTSC